MDENSARALFPTWAETEVTTEKKRDNSYTLWVVGWLGKWVLIALALVLYTITIARYADARAEKKYEDWKVRYVNDYLEQQEAARAGMPVDPYTAQLDYEAGMLAKVLYGVKDNSEEDLKTYCWCVFNRVDNPMFPDMIEDVISQPKQWMRYSENNLVLDNLFKIAREQLDEWHSGATRPVGSDYVYMDWTPSRITLRNQWEYGRETETWRYGQ